MILKNVYRNKKILITGHTGFKGSWLSAWLILLGAKVIGISDKFSHLPPKISLYQPRSHQRRTAYWKGHLSGH